MIQRVSETHSEPNQTSKTELFVKIIWSWNPLTISAKTLNAPLSLVLDKVWVDKGAISLIHIWKINKNQSVAESYRSGKCGGIKKNIKCLRCHEV